MKHPAPFSCHFYVTLSGRSILVLADVSNQSNDFNQLLLAVSGALYNEFYSLQSRPEVRFAFLCVARVFVQSVPQQSES